MIKRCGMIVKETTIHKRPKEAYRVCTVNLILFIEKLHIFIRFSYLILITTYCGYLNIFVSLLVWGWFSILPVIQKGWSNSEIVKFIFTSFCEDFFLLNMHIFFRIGTVPLINYLSIYEIYQAKNKRFTKILYLKKKIIVSFGISQIEVDN